ncbi:uncharacterized protein [Rutidosis leptorrhynchoides]|uniref:uncharacterized protein n=1 Tax=Rutidosis leptorrhynchoides TaxID=125765 RepID=UPI003A98F45F
MATDDSFKKPGSVPFKWEIRPGVPKPLNHHQPPSNRLSLKPPPSSPTSFHFPSSRTHSSHYHNRKPIMGRTEVVSLGCFQPRKVYSQKKSNKLRVDPTYKTDLETLSQWSMLTKKSGSPFRDSPLSTSSFSSYRSSPLMANVSDAEWAGYGLF